MQRVVLTVELRTVHQITGTKVQFELSARDSENEDGDNVTELL